MTKEYLSKHFTLEEMYKSQTAIRLGIDNKPGDNEKKSLKRLCENVLEPIRYKFNIPFTPSSAYRSPALNKAIGGSNNSQHIKGEAADIELRGIPNHFLAFWIKEHLAFDQIILEFYSEHDPSSGWVHVSYSDKLRMEVLRTQDGKHYEPITF